MSNVTKPPQHPASSRTRMTSVGPSGSAASLSARVRQRITSMSLSGSVVSRIASGRLVQMKRQIGLLQAISIMTGVVIGSGIFVSPVSITRHCGSVGMSLVVWCLSGVLTMLTALCYAELALRYPRAGGEYNYYKQVIGKLPAFMFVWLTFIVLAPAFFTVLALTTANYLLKPLFISCNLPDHLSKVFSIWIVVSLNLLNCSHVKYVTRLQTVFLFAKVLALFIIIIAGIVQLVKGNFDQFINPFEKTTTDFGGIAIAMYAGLFTYNGWQTLFALVEEIDNPERNIAPTVYFSLGLCIIIYVLTNVAYFTVLTPAQLVSSEAVALTFSAKAIGPVAPIIPLMVACSTIGALNGSILGASRITFAAARDGLFPKSLGMISIRYKTPSTSILSTLIVTVLYHFSGESVSLIEYLGFTTSFVIIMSMICLIISKRRTPDVKVAFKVPFWLPVVVTIIITSLTFLGLYKDPFKNGIGVLMALSGIPVYFISSSCRKIASYNNLQNSIHLILQKILFVISQENSVDE